MIAQRKIVPYTVPAFREETMSPAPTPVAAMINPGPTILSRLPKVEGTSVLGSRSLATSAIFTFLHARYRDIPWHIRHWSRSEYNGADGGESRWVRESVESAQDQYVTALRHVAGKLYPSPD